MKDGVLTIRVPKHPEAKPKRISLKGVVEAAKEVKDKVVDKLKA